MHCSSIWWLQDICLKADLYIHKKLCYPQDFSLWTSALMLIWIVYMEDYYEQKDKVCETNDDDDRQIKRTASFLSKKWPVVVVVSILPF